MKFSAILLLAAALVGDVVAKGNSTKPATPGKALDKQCKSIAKWTSQIALANNQTKLDELMTKKNLTMEQITKIKDKATNATTQLKTAQGNTTLTSMCDEAAPVEKACGQMKAVMKLTELATNQTKLDKITAKKNLTQEQVTKIKDKATQAQTKLKTLQGNTTLVSMCDAFSAAKKTEDGKTMAAIKAMSNMTTQKATSKSGAADLGYSLSVLSTALLVGFGMVMA